MIRYCDGTDRYLIGEGGGSCHCGLLFDDVRRLVKYPHEFIPTPEMKELRMSLYQEYLNEITSAQHGSPSV